MKVNLAVSCSMSETVNLLISGMIVHAEEGFIAGYKFFRFIDMVYFEVRCT